MVSTQRGSIKKRNGSTLFTKAGEVPNTELTSFFASSDQAATWTFISNGETIWTMNPGGVVAEIGKGFTAGSRWEILQLPRSTTLPGQGPYYFVNGVDKPQQWVGAKEGEAVKPWTGQAGETFYENATTKEHVPNGKYMVYAGERVWMAGMSDDNAAVRFSEAVPQGEGGEIPDPTNWPKNNLIRFDPEDGSPITGLGLVGPYVLVFKETKTWVIHDLAEGENRRISDTIGCVSHRSITETQGGTFFLTANAGIYLTNGSTLTEVSYPVRPTILAINQKERSHAAGAFFNNHFYLSFASGSSTKNNRTLDYDTQLKSWWLHDLAANQWATYQPTPSAEPGLYCIPAKVKAGVVHAFVSNIWTDSGENYTGNGVLGAYWLSPWDPFGYYVFRHRVKAPMLKKRIRQVFFNGEGQIIPALYRNFHTGERQEGAVVGAGDMSKPEKPVNFLAGSEKWGEGVGKWGEEVPGTEILWGGESAIGQARMYAPGVAFIWSVGYGNNSDQNFVVNSFVLTATFRKS